MASGETRVMVPCAHPRSTRLGWEGFGGAWGRPSQPVHSWRPYPTLRAHSSHCGTAHNHPPSRDGMRYLGTSPRQVTHRGRWFLRAVWGTMVLGIGFLWARRHREAGVNPLKPRAALGSERPGLGLTVGKPVLQRPRRSVSCPALKVALHGRLLTYF